MLNCVVLWNTRYLDAAVNALRMQGMTISTADLARISPCGSRRLNTQGRYDFLVPTAAAGKQLTTGPRGGGRSLEGIARHVLEVDGAYLRRLARSVRVSADEPLVDGFKRVRAAIEEALAAAVRGEIPAHEPRGGALWTPRYYVRRSVWHVLDHAWEIEDRSGLTMPAAPAGSDRER